VEQIALKGDEAVDEWLDAKMQDLVKATRESSPNFQQARFQCVGDYQTAVTAGYSKIPCWVSTSGLPRVEALHRESDTG